MEDDLFFLHSENRRFVAGRRKRNAQWSHHVDRLFIALFIVSIIVGFAVLHFGFNAFEPNTVAMEIWGCVGVVFILSLKGTADFLEARKHADLSSRGQILWAEITGAKHDKHAEDGEYWDLEFAFVSPLSSQRIQGREAGRGVYNQKPQREIQVLFLDDQTFCAL